MESSVLRIGEVARRAGVHRETVRYYERRALFPPPPRRASGYRAYPAETVERVRLIKWAQKLGFTLREIAEFARLPGDHVHGRRRRVRAQAEAKIREIDGRIETLKMMRGRLRAIVRCRCRGDCPIVTRAIRGGGRQPRAAGPPIRDG